MNYLARINNLQNKIRENALDAFLISNPTDLFYFTGVKVSAGKLLVDLKQATFIVDGRYLESCKKSSPFPVVLSSENILGELLTHVKKLGIDGETITHQFFLDLEKECTRKNISLSATKGLISTLRAIKDSQEITLLKEASALGVLGFNFVLNNLKEGVLEAELSFQLEMYWRQKGAIGVSFEPIIAFGSNSSMPHYRSAKAQLKKGDIVLIDIGVHLNHYHSDMTRVVFFGNPDPKLIEIREIVDQARLKALELCKPGTEIENLDAAARGWIEEKGYGPYFTHSLGHGIGLDVHESPTVRKSLNGAKLQQGMAITIEPGIYLPGLGGVRIEDTIVITQDSHENLTNQDTYFFIDV